jgi:hypothetical protein
MLGLLDTVATAVATPDTCARIKVASPVVV